MKFLYGLALALIFFEGFISQCVGAGGSEDASTSLNLRNLPSNVYEEILFRTGFSATEDAAKDRQRSSAAVKKILEDRIIQIVPINFDNEKMHEFDLGGYIYLNIYGVNKALSLFKNFGNLIKKIKVDYKFIDQVDDNIRHQINENIITKYAKQFTEFHIVASNAFLTFLDELSNGGERIRFPNVKKLVYHGPDFGNSYDLNSIFPNLESLTLHYNYMYVSNSFMQINMTCMENVTKLKELKLEINPDSYQLHELEKVFSKNKQLSTLGLVLTNKIDILRSVEIHAKAVQTLDIQVDSTEFLNHVSEKHSFNMPTLKKLHLSKSCRDCRIINFINCFKKLKTLEVWTHVDFIVSNFEKLIEINEFIMNNIPFIMNTKKILQIFGRKKKLNMVKWEPVAKDEYNTFKFELSDINKELKQSHEPTWKINYINPKTSYGYILMMRSK